MQILIFFIIKVLLAIVMVSLCIDAVHLLVRLSVCCQKAYIKMRFSENSAI